MFIWSVRTGVAPVWREEISGLSSPIRRFAPNVLLARAMAVSILADCLAEGTRGRPRSRKSRRCLKVHPGKQSRHLRMPENQFCSGRIQCGVVRVNGKAFVDFQNDVTAKDIATGLSMEGFVSVEHMLSAIHDRWAWQPIRARRRMSTGIAHSGASARTSQSQTSGTTRFRPPYSPVAIGAFAGHERGMEFQPIRRTAMHECGMSSLARCFVEAGQWLAAAILPQAGGRTLWRRSSVRSKQVRRDRRHL